MESKIKYSKGTDFSSRIEKWIAFEDVIKGDILSSVLEPIEYLLVIRSNSPVTVYDKS